MILGATGGSCSPSVAMPCCEPESARSVGDAGGMREAAEIVDPTCGALTEPGDAEAVAAALRNLIQDPSWRQALGAANPIRAALLWDPARQLNAAALPRPVEVRRGR